MCVLRFGKEQQRFDTRNVSVQVGYGLFVFKIGYGTYSPQDCRNVSFLSFDNCQVVVGDDFDPGSSANNSRSISTLWSGV